MCLLSFVAIPIDALMAKLQYMDARGDALLDLTSPTQNPLQLCQQSVMTMLRDGLRLPSPLAPLFKHSAVPGCMHDVAREIPVNVACQLSWRLSAFERYPLKLARVCHAGLEDSDRKQLAEDFFSTPQCCLDEDFSWKIRTMFSFADDMLQCKPFMSGLRLWAASAKVTNMHLGRRLAQIKQHLSCTAAPDAERMTSVGYLGQALLLLLLSLILLDY